MVPLKRPHRRQVCVGLTLRRWVPYLLLALGCQLSLGAAWFVSSTAEARARTAFQVDAQETRQQIQSGLNAYIEVVRAGTAARRQQRNQLYGVPRVRDRP
jgi:CHASE1-domain containing sensor protein